MPTGLTGLPLHVEQHNKIRLGSARTASQARNQASRKNTTALNTTKHMTLQCKRCKLPNKNLNNRLIEGDAFTPADIEWYRCCLIIPSLIQTSRPSAAVQSFNMAHFDSSQLHGRGCWNTKEANHIWIWLILKKLSLINLIHCFFWFYHSIVINRVD